MRTADSSTGGGPASLARRRRWGQVAHRPPSSPSYTSCSPEKSCRLLFPKPGPASGLQSLLLSLAGRCLTLLKALSSELKTVPLRRQVCSGPPGPGAEYGSMCSLLVNGMASLLPADSIYPSYIYSISGRCPSPTPTSTFTPNLGLQ